MIKTEYLVDMSDFTLKMDRLVEEYGDLSFAFGEIVRSLNKYNREQFTLKGNGQYAPLAPSTVAQKLKKHGTREIKVKSVRTAEHRAANPKSKAKYLYTSTTVPGVPILVDTGKLRDSLTKATADQIKLITKTRMLYGTKVKYAGYIHGGTKFKSGPRAGEQRMLARPILLWNKPRKEMAIRIFDNYITTQTAKIFQTAAFLNKKNVTKT